MTKPKKHSVLYTALILTAVNLAVFFIVYVANYLLDSAFLVYFSMFTSEFLNSAFPIAAAALSVVIYSKATAPYAFAIAAAVVASRAAYFYPLAYLDCVAAGYVTAEALLLAILNTLLSLLVIYLEVMLISTLIVFLTTKIAMAKDKKRRGPILSEELSVKEPLDFSHPAAVAHFSGACVIFLISLVTEIVSTVKFLIDFSGTYRASEIVYMSFRYVFILITLILSHILAFFVKNVWLNNAYDGKNSQKAKR